MERTLVLIKPDGVCKRLIGEVIKKIELEGFKVVALKMLHFSREEARKFYRTHEGKYFFSGLIDFMLTAPSVALVVEGEGVVKKVREIIGERKPEDASPESIRGRYASDGRRNIVHGSDSSLSARQEIECLFNPEEIYSYEETDWLKGEPG
ncbi:MAG: nucleoside-diphosphate kinase [Candidatus Aerophobetes bacterium]|nr:nucleoside-diphosphate kinase [Candidatus Aerophobetes bacterium]